MSHGNSPTRRTPRICSSCGAPATTRRALILRGNRPRKPPSRVPLCYDCVAELDPNPLSQSQRSSTP